VVNKNFLKTSSKFPYKRQEVAALELAAVAPAFGRRAGRFFGDEKGSRKEKRAPKRPFLSGWGKPDQ